MSISKLLRARLRASCLVAGSALAVLAHFAGPAHADEAALTRQRAAFRVAYAAAQAGQPAPESSTTLTDYPLFPYLEAARLQQAIATVPLARIAAYLQRYAGLIPANDLRRATLTALAQRHDWANFSRYYQPGLGNDLNCAALQGRLASGQALDFARDLAPLWQQSQLPKDCQPVLSAAAAQGLLTPARIWARIGRAATDRQGRTITAMLADLPTAERDAARRTVQALDDPAALLAQARALADTPRNRDALVLALTNLARKDSAAAIKSWQTLHGKFGFDGPQRDAVLAALALYHAVEGGADAVQRLAALPAAAQTDATRGWRARAAVVAGDWHAVLAAIAALTPAQQQDGEWQYWQAHADLQLGHADAARDAYTALAQRTTFYGFLAADQIGAPYSICPQTLALDPGIAATLLAMPGLQRAFEFYALDLLPQARREWSRALATLSTAEQNQAAAIAASVGWHDRAIGVFSSNAGLHYYALRFPLADADRVQTAASATGLDPAWVFAIIRAETAWQTDAQSGADARGLMQLLPATAAHVARRNGLPWAGAESLYDPAVNVALGTRYLATLALRFDGSPWLAAAAYNAGPSKTNSWLNDRPTLAPAAFILNIPYQETRDYVTRVLSFATLYDWRLHGTVVPVSSRLPAIGASPAADPGLARKHVVCRTPAPAAAASTTTVRVESSSQSAGSNTP